MARNYFKVMTGSIANRTVKQEFFMFDDDDPQAMWANLERARDCFGVRGAVSVYRAAITVPSSVPVIGDPKSADLLAAAGE